MRRLARALGLAALLCPAAAWAQYPPPYRYVPPPPPPPPVASPQGHLQNRFYLNFGLGYGDGAADLGPYSVSLHDWLGSTAGAGGLGFHAEGGMRMLPPLLLGLDLTGLTVSGAAQSGVGLNATLIDYDTVLTLFPLGDGPFLRAGAGLSTLASSVAAPVGYTSVTRFGTNVLAGVGWAFRLSGSAHLTLGLDWSQQFFGAPDLRDSSFWMGRVGFGWY